MPCEEFEQFVKELLEARKWVGRPFVQQHGVVTSNDGIDGGIFVTTGLFSDDARDLERSIKGRRSSIRLIHGKELWAAV